MISFLDDSGKTSPPVGAGGEEYPGGKPEATPGQTTPGPITTPEEPTITPGPTTPGPTTPPEEPTPVPVNFLSFEFEALTLSMGNIDGVLETPVYITLEEEILSSYHIIIIYQKGGILSVEPNNWLEVGKDGFIDRQNSNANNMLTITGRFDPGDSDRQGIGPGVRLHLFTIRWRVEKSGQDHLEFKVSYLQNPSKMNISVGQTSMDLKILDEVVLPPL